MTSSTAPLRHPVNSVNGDLAGSQAAAKNRQLRKAAEDFEGILISAWLEEVQKSSLDPSSSAMAAGSDTLRSLGTEAVARALAQRGGLGIARTIVNHYTAVSHAGTPAAKTLNPPRPGNPKGTGRGADKEIEGGESGPAAKPA